MTNQKEELNRAELEELAIQKFMTYKENRTFMRRILQDAGMDATGFHPEMHVQSYNLGARRTGFYIVNRLKAAAPKMYLKMIAEQLEEDTDVD